MDRNIYIYDCEDEWFSDRRYCYRIDRMKGYLPFLMDKTITQRQIIFVTLRIPHSQRVIEGFVRRADWKRVQRRNLQYCFDGTLYNIRDVTANVEYSVTECRQNGRKADRVLILADYVP